MHDSSVKEFLREPTRFEDTINQNKLHTFASECVAIKRQRRIQLRLNLDAQISYWIRIVLIAAVMEIDLEYVFSFPLTPVPQSLVNRDGVLAKTDESKPLNVLEDSIKEHGNPNIIGTYIIDGNFLLHCMAPDQP